MGPVVRERNRGQGTPGANYYYYEKVPYVLVVDPEFHKECQAKQVVESEGLVLPTNYFQHVAELFQHRKIRDLVHLDSFLRH